MHSLEKIYNNSIGNFEEDKKNARYNWAAAAGKIRSLWESTTT